MENIPTDKQYPKLSKASWGYLEIEQFKNADCTQDTFVITVCISLKILIVQ